ncbi:MAG: hypothetical protein KDB90_18100 [Planctomycetes bacterium]|nr:hypothetical protein [Planctomycetota bacterium]
MALWDVFQHYQIKRADLAAKDAQRDARHTGLRMESELSRLESKVDGLALICQALVELLQEQGGVSDEEIARRIDEIDLRDGRADGRLTGGPIPCPECARPAHTRQRVCMYCSTRIDQGMLLEKIGRGAAR